MKDLESAINVEHFCQLNWYISEDTIIEDTIIQPDNLVLCYKPIKNYISKAPVPIFEVVSKSTAKKDEIKYELYEREGVEYYVSYISR